MSELSKVVHPFFQPRQKQPSPYVSSSTTNINKPLSSATVTASVENGATVPSLSSATEGTQKKQDNSKQSLLNSLKPSTPSLQEAELVDSSNNPYVAKTKVPTTRGRPRKVATAGGRQTTATAAAIEDQKREERENEKGQGEHSRPKKRTKRTTHKAGANINTDSRAVEDTNTKELQKTTEVANTVQTASKATSNPVGRPRKKLAEVPSRKSARIAARQFSKPTFPSRRVQQKPGASTSSHTRRKPPPPPPALEYCTDSFATLMEGPQFYHDPEEVYHEFEKEILLNVYGIDSSSSTKKSKHRKNKKNDHEFSRLNPDVFDTGHIVAADKSIQYPTKTPDQGIIMPAFRSKSKGNNISDIIKNGQTAFFQSQKLKRGLQNKQKLTGNNSHSFHSKHKLITKTDVEAFLNAYFPHWHTFSSCVLLLQSIFDTKNRPKNDYFVRENMKKQWTDKYRPKTAEGLLGARHNFMYLKDWLQQMKIEPITASSTANGKKKTKRATKKKKKLAMMEDDIIMDDEDTFHSNGLQRALNAYDNDDDEDDDFVLKPASATKKKLQLQKDAMKSNIILLIGDHGIGKTAAVYTVADQLDYEVFEINSGTRRSGKDIISMVGDMTKNHLVAFGSAPPLSAASLFVDKPSTSRSTITDDGREVKSKRKRKRLNPLFKPSASIDQNDKSNSGAISDIPSGIKEANDEPITELPQQQPGLLKHFLRKKDPLQKKLSSSTSTSMAATTKQSLILLEEVDILFEEDKGFWNSVIELSQSSKRPIIMTCNDPDQIPFENLCLQIVLELKPPTETELLPYLWLLCYAEGHIVDPKDLLCFTAFFGHDIRKLIQTLNVELSAKKQQSMFLNHLGITAATSLDSRSESDRIECLVDMRKKCIPSKLAVNTFRLAIAYDQLLELDNTEGMVIANDGYKDGKEKEERQRLENFLQALNNNAFVDSWLTWKHGGTMVQRSDIDQINGYTTLYKEDEAIEGKPACIFEDLESCISVLNNDIYSKSSSSLEKWSKLTFEENSYWDELCDTR
ncbi:hypothetical protein BDF20DRAFT_327247 [Mycotypha africana]|uniref:uncharacterized protein n=1 Tax=Mycotypha africana TaxID=64632 RepID=UPI002300F251|nr:uncharacterized protein BDF20DRAFT_327247 [Mycotypha africana]KAI8988353.1 hypothetical protein BDF20DRAFT_327247 [Mycotypha africana]